MNEGKCVSKRIELHEAIVRTTILLPPKYTYLNKKRSYINTSDIQT